MNRITLALALLCGVCATLASAPAAEAAAVRQSEWAAAKKFVSLPNGLRMAYVELGDPKGEPLLLLHGFTDSSRTWSLVAPYLARYRLLIPDQRGHGATDAPECCYGPTQFAYDATLFLDALKIERAAVAGHSMGSIVAVALAADYPERVTSIALLGSTGLAAVKRGDWLWTNATAVKLPIDRHSQFMREWHPANQPTPIDAKFASAAMEEILTVKPQVWRGVMRELADVPVDRHAADVKVPVLILSGGADPIFTTEHHAALLQAFPAANAYVYPGLGHNFLWEQPADVAARLDAFFRGRDR